MIENIDRVVYIPENSRLGDDMCWRHEMKFQA
jgi:hypothetical protein